MPLGLTFPRQRRWLPSFVLACRPRLFLAVATLLVFACDGAARAAAPASSIHAAPPSDLITAAIDQNARITLADQRPPWATPANDLGAVSDELMLRNLSIRLNRTSEREVAFQHLLAAQQNPASPEFHRWLTPVEVGEQFGASQQDIDAITSWLEQSGLNVDGVANSRTRILFSGTAAAVAKALATRLHVFQVGSKNRIANADDPRIPAAFAQVIGAVHGLYATERLPQIRTAHGLRAAASGKARFPQDTYCPSSSSCQYTVFPADFAKIYDIDPVTSAGITGSGQTIAIVGKARVYGADLTNFQNLAGVSFSAPGVIVPPNGRDPGSPATSCTTSNPDTCDNPSDAVQNQSEATLDVERAASIAPGAGIDLIVSADINSSDGTLLEDGSDLATNYAIDTSPVPARILSISFTVCEAEAGAADTQSQNQLFEQAAAEGVSVFVASGDSGAAGCEGQTSTPGAGQSPSINELCASGYVTCVGGTEFADGADPNQYWATSDSSNFLSALGYIPEGAWNDPVDDKGHPQFDATGGGVSVYTSTPTWQKGPGVPGTQGRYTPDVSFAASPREGYFTCFAAGGGSCVVSSGSFEFVGAGGTSASAPDMAAIAALLNQKQGGAQGNLNPHLYALAQAPANGVFHDVTVASSGVAACTISTPSLCNNSTPGASGLSGGLAGYPVGSGYDEATGLGSIDVANLLAQWSAPTGVNLDQYGITGSWYNPATGGQGFVMEVYPDVSGPGQGLLFAGWFTYDVTAAGGRRWYIVTGPVSSSSPTASLQMGVSEGGNFNAPPIIDASLVGEATLTLSDCSTGTLTYQFSDGSGRSGTIPLKRLTPNERCAPAGDNGGAPTDYLLSGTWYDPQTSGQGFVFDINPTISLLFAAWYTFKPNGEQIGGTESQDWYTLQTPSFTNGTTSLAGIPIIQTTGGVFDNSTPVSTTQVGSANITVQSCSAMTLTYHFTAGQNNGLSGTLNLQRLGPVPDGCSL
jgi:pseudomonalisin